MKVNYWAIPGLLKELKLKENSYIIQYVCKHENISYSELIIRSRERILADVRFVLAALLKRFTKKSLSEVGEDINRDHSTVAHAKKQCNPGMPLHKKYKQYEQELQKQIL